MYYLNWLAKFALMAMILFWGAFSFAAPQISEVRLVGESPNGQALYQISGAGFGLKAQAAPVLYDLGDYAYQNGVISRHQETFDSSRAIERADVDPETLWIKPSNGNVTLSTTSSRSEGVTRGYSMNSGNAFLGWPAAYGGFNTPPDNSKLYVSWWYRSEIDQSKYYAFGFDDKVGDLSPGESVSVQGFEAIQASLIGVDGHHLALRIDDLGGFAMNKAAWNGLKVVGLQSGASALLNTSTHYLPAGGSSKFVRIWEEESGFSGLRLSWTNMHMTLARPSGGDIVSWERATIPGGEWVHLEIFVDLESNRVKRWVNANQLDDVDITEARRTGGVSPTIALLGINGEQQFNKADVSEIYMDSTQQRIVLADAAAWHSVTHYELQRPSLWSSSSLEFEFYQGSLREENDMYLYVIDENGAANSAGFKLSVGLNPPKAPINLNLRVN